MKRERDRPMDRQKESGRREWRREFLESNVPSATHDHLRKREGSGGRRGGGGVDEESSGESSYFNVPSTARCRPRREGWGVVLTLALTLVYCEGHQPIHKGGGGGGGEY